MKKYYKLNFYKKYIEVEIIYIPKDNIDKNKLFYVLILYFELNNIIIKYKNNIISNKKEQKLIFYNILLRKIYITTIYFCQQLEKITIFFTSNIDLILSINNIKLFFK